MTTYKTIEDYKDRTPKGATHYRDECDDWWVTFYKVVNGDTYQFFHESKKGWTKNPVINIYKDRAIKELKLETKQPKFKYVKVEEEIFELKAEFEACELYFNAFMDDYCVIDNIKTLAGELEDCNIYRRVELTEEEELIEVITELSKEWWDMPTDANSVGIAEYLANSGKLQLKK